MCHNGVALIIFFLPFFSWRISQSGIQFIQSLKRIRARLQSPSKITPLKLDYNLLNSWKTVNTIFQAERPLFDSLEPRQTFLVSSLINKQTNKQQITSTETAERMLMKSSGKPWKVKDEEFVEQKQYINTAFLTDRVITFYKKASATKQIRPQSNAAICHKSAGCLLESCKKVNIPNQRLWRKVALLAVLTIHLSYFIVVSIKPSRRKELCPVIE